MERFKNNTVIFRDCAYKNGKLYFFDADNVIPISLDLDNGKFKILPIENIKQFRGIPFDLETEWENCLYAVEMDGKYMCRYQLDTGHVKYIEINCGIRKDGNLAFLEAYNDYIYIFNRFGMVVIYDTKTETVHTVDAAVQDKEFITGCHYGQSYYLFSNDGTTVLEFDIGSGNWKTHNSTDMLAGQAKVIHAVCDETKIYILFENASIVVWNVMENRKQQIDIAKFYYKSNPAVSRICITDRNIIVLPSLEKDIVCIEKQTGEAYCMDTYPPDFQYDAGKKKWSKYIGYCENDTAYYFACRTSEYILEVSKLSGKLKWIKSKIDTDEPFYYDIAHGVLYEKEGYLELMLKEIL